MFMTLGGKDIEIRKLKNVTQFLLNEISIISLLIKSKKYADIY